MLKKLLILPVLLAALTFYFGTPLLSVMMPQAATYDDNPEGAPANNNLQTVDENGNRIKCEDLTEAKGGVLLGRIVPCVSRTIASSTQTLSAKFIDAFKPLLYSYMVLVVALFGAKVLQGGRGLHQQGIVLLLKITLVVGILDLIPGTIVPAVYNVMEEAQSVVTSTLGPDSSSINCDVSKYKDGNTPLIWAQMDCVLGKLYGFTTGKTTYSDTAGTTPHNMFLAASVIGLASGFLFSGTLGVTIFFACIGVLVSMFLMVMRTAVSFVNGYLTVCVMLLIAPLLLPLTFTKITQSYFERWWQTILAGMLMPLLVTGYTMFALLLYDQMLFSKNALINNLFDYKLVKETQVPPQNLCGRPTTGNLDFTNVSTLLGGLKQKMLDPMTHDDVHPEQTGANNGCVSLKRHVIALSQENVQKLDPSNPNPNAVDFIKHVFIDCLKLIILAFLIHEGMQAVIGAMATITGSQSTSGLLTASSPQELALKQRLDNARLAVREAMVNRDEDGKGGSYSGFRFFEQIGPAAENALKRGLMDR